MYKPREVFQPKAFPKLTYIDRSMDEDSTYEEELENALEDTGTLVVITGASKSGKTVLCHKVVERERYISLSGSQIQSQSDFWEQIAEQLDMPAELQITESTHNNISVKASGKGKVNMVVAGGEASGEIGGAHTTGDSIQRKLPRSNAAVMKYIIEQDKVIVIDDFHYIEQSIQKYIARTIKAELFNGLKAIILTLPHRSDDAIRLNPDLIGRTAFIDISAWTISELKEIAQKGFALLKISAKDEQIGTLAQESMASPELMQENCLKLANIMLKSSEQQITTELMEKAFRLTTKNYDHYANILGTASKGPLQGQKRRTIYNLKDGRKMDIYGLLFASISKDPPIISLSIDEIKERFRQLLTDNNKLPTTLNTANSIKHIEKIIKDQVPDLDTVEWKDSCLYILDPFLLFYLRWCDAWKA